VRWCDDTGRVQEAHRADKALERRLQPVFVGEPSVDATIQMLKGLRPVRSAHKVTITDAAIEAAVKLSKRYITSASCRTKPSTL